jgi:acetyltransferase-like isoleucine patch superfamily enzyme
MPKKIIRPVFAVIVFPVYISYIIWRSFFEDKDRVFRSFAEFLSQFPGRTGEYIRYAFYKNALTKCGKDCCISYGTIFSHPTVILGNNVYIGLYCIIGHVNIGDNTLIASRVSIPSGRHQHSGSDANLSLNEQKTIFQQVNIGSNTWIGEGAVVLQDVGNNCVIGAGSVVVNPIDNSLVAVGNPAKAIKKKE